MRQNPRRVSVIGQKRVHQTKIDAAALKTDDLDQRQRTRPAHQRFIAPRAVGDNQATGFRIVPRRADGHATAGRQQPGRIRTGPPAPGSRRTAETRPAARTPELRTERIGRWGHEARSWPGRRPVRPASQPVRPRRDPPGGPAPFGSPPRRERELRRIEKDPRSDQGLDRVGRLGRGQTHHACRQGHGDPQRRPEPETGCMAFRSCAHRTSVKGQTVRSRRDD